MDAESNFLVWVDSKRANGTGKDKHHEPISYTLNTLKFCHEYIGKLREPISNTLNTLKFCHECIGKMRERFFKGCYLRVEIFCR
jgi:hypothetical protein